MSGPGATPAAVRRSAQVAGNTAPPLLAADTRDTARDTTLGRGYGQIHLGTGCPFD